MSLWSGNANINNEKLASGPEMLLFTMKNDPGSIAGTATLLIHPACPGAPVADSGPLF